MWPPKQLKNLSVFRAFWILDLWIQDCGLGPGAKRCSKCPQGPQTGVHRTWGSCKVNRSLSEPHQIQAKASWEEGKILTEKKGAKQ